MILIDRRTGSVELARYFSEDEAELADLKFGDFAFQGNGPEGKVEVGIERKHIQDLVDSIKSGRLWGHQIPGMIDMYDYNYLVVEGPFKAQPDYLMVPRGRRWVKLWLGTKCIDPFLNTIQVLTGVMLRETSGKKATATLVKHLHQWWSRPFNDHGEYGAYQRSVRLPKRLTNGALLFKVCQTLPAIGMKKGLEIKEHFSCVVDMVNATEEEWLEIPGIGEKTVKTIREALGHEIV